LFNRAAFLARANWSGRAVATTGYRFIAAGVAVDAPLDASLTAEDVIAAALRRRFAIITARELTRVFPFVGLAIAIVVFFTGTIARLRLTSWARLINAGTVRPFYLPSSASTIGFALRTDLVLTDRTITTINACSVGKACLLAFTFLRRFGLRRRRFIG